MKIVSVESLQGAMYEELGIVTGSTIQSKNMFSDLGQGLKSIVGGELKSYTGMMEKARAQAQQRMVDQAVKMGADAIIGVRYTTSAIMAQAAEVLVYGTAIRYKQPSAGIPFLPQNLAPFRQCGPVENEDFTETFTFDGETAGALTLEDQSVAFAYASGDDGPAIAISLTPEESEELGFSRLIFRQIRPPPLPQEE